MAQREDKEIFDWVDRLNPKVMDGVEEIAPYEDEKVDEATWHRIRKRTFARLEAGLEDGEKKPKLSRKTIYRRWLVAASAVIIVVTAFVSVSPDARAEIKKMLQFIPGFGFVQPDVDSDQVAYILPKPLESNGEYGKITVEGMLIQSSGGQIFLEGDNLSGTSVDNLTLVTEQGEFAFKRGHSSWGEGGPWLANFYYEGEIPSGGLEHATLKFGNITISTLHLERAENADDLADFGSSDSRNDIRITGVVTPLDGSHRKVNLLTLLPEGQKVDSFGKQPIAEGLDLQLSGDGASELSINQDIGFIKAQELLFDDPTGSEFYQLIIPAIRIVDSGAKKVKVTLPVPEEGTREVTVTSRLADFPVEFTKIERVSSELVRIDVNTHFDVNQERTLQNYRLFKKDGGFMSYSSKLNDGTNAVEAEWLSVEPGQKEITFYMGEPQIVVKGPWILNDLR